MNMYIKFALLIMQRYKNIRITGTTYDELSKLGNLQDSFDTVIHRLIHSSGAAVASTHGDCD